MDSDTTSTSRPTSIDVAAVLEAVLRPDGTSADGALEICSAIRAVLSDRVLADRVMQVLVSLVHGAVALQLEVDPRIRRDDLLDALIGVVVAADQL